jgi:hypothetical protein
MTPLRPFLILSGSLISLVCAGASARGDFVLTTSVTGVSESGGTIVSSAALAPGSTFVIESSTITAANGGMSYTDAAGTTIYFLNDSRSSGTLSVTNEQIFVANTTSGATDTGVFTFTMNIAVTNNGETKTFTESPNTVTLELGGSNANYLVAAGALAPPSQLIGGLTFDSSLPQAVSGDINSANNGGVSAVISAVPEPSTIALLGVGGLMLIAPRLRRLARRLGSS